MSGKTIDLAVRELPRDFPHDIAGIIATTTFLPGNKLSADILRRLSSEPRLRETTFQSISTMTACAGFQSPSRITVIVERMSEA